MTYGRLMYGLEARVYKQIPGNRVPRKSYREVFSRQKADVPEKALRWPQNVLILA